MNKTTQYILDYLNNQMDPKTRAEFEKQLAHDRNLRQQLDDYKELMQGAVRSGQKEAIKKGLKTGRTKSIIRKIVLTTLVTIAVVGIIVVIKQQIVSGNSSTHLRYELNERNQRQWANADKYLESQIFSIDGSKDTVIETKGGILLSIPAKNFLNATAEAVSGEIELEVKEALNPLDIMKAGLTTFSNGRLLETGGMFYVNARQNAKNLDIDQSKGIHASIPEINPGKPMLLFDGQRLPNGEINWINPRQLENALHTVDIMSLNFYPPHFLDTLQKMGFDIKNKQLTDSIYYSYVCGASPSAPGDSAKTVDFNDVEYWDQPWNNTQQLMRGEKLFRQNCSVCHSAGTQMLTGPGLAGVTQRAPKGDWLVKFILNNEKLIKSGDEYANRIYRQYGKAAMTVFEGQLTETDVNTIIAYIDNNSAESFPDKGQQTCEIAPYRIKAIHNRQFNSTLLATKAFEERLQSIFKTCNPSLLELYTRNLDKKMYQLDSMAAEMLSGINPELANVFQKFYLRHDGGVEISDTRMQKLAQYLHVKQTLFKQAAIQTMQDSYAKEQVEKERAREVFQKHEWSEFDRINDNISKELELNLKEAYRQVGKEYKPTPPPADRYLNATIVSTGWKNLDAYVLTSTANRETLNYKDQQSGKQAIIIYNPVTLKLEHEKEYDRVIAYLLPGKGLSFQLMSQTGSEFSEKLNELVTYDAFVLGFKGNKLYAQTLTNIKTGQHKVNLAELSLKEQEVLKQQNIASTRNLWEEIEFQIFSQNESIKQEKIRKKEEIRQKLWPVVFPCGGNSVTDSVAYEGN
ncbi:MAG: cytochrome c [Sediminibacterium sp.]|nr:cytochrome c [Sediminibacterium sp.]